MSQGERYLILAIGIVLMAVGIILFYKMKSQGNNRIKLFGMEAELSAPSLVIFVFGSAFVMFPFLVGQSTGVIDGSDAPPVVQLPNLPELPMLNQPSVSAPEPVTLQHPDVLFGDGRANPADGYVTPLVNELPPAAPQLLPPEALFGEQEFAAFEVQGASVDIWEDVFETLPDRFSNEYLNALEDLYGHMPAEQFTAIPAEQIAIEIRNEIQAATGLSVSTQIRDAEFVQQKVARLINY